MRSLIILVSCMLCLVGRIGWGDAGRIELSQGDFVDNSTYSISQSGSFILTENITVTGDVAGITIAAHDVTIDLNGFCMMGSAPTYERAAILQLPSYRNTMVRNGFLTGWGGNLNTESVVALQGHGNLVEDLTIAYNQGAGIYFAGESLARRCIFHNNARHGISANTGSRIEECVAYWNSSGVRIEEGVEVRDCVFVYNTNAVFMISNCVVQTCLLVENTNSFVFGGITPSRNVMKDNHFVRNGQGIVCNDHSLFFNNSGVQNIGGNFSLAGDVVYGPILTLTTNSFSTNNPYVNFSLP